MAGSPLKLARVTALTQEVAELHEEIRRLKAKVKHEDYTAEEPRVLNDSTRLELIRDMLGMADAGLSIEEIASAWNVTPETLREWATVDVAFGTAALRARTRARAATMASLRRLMEAGRGVPAAFADRMMAMHSASLGDVEGADALIRLDLADDGGSCPHCGLDLGAPADRPSVADSDGG